LRKLLSGLAPIHLATLSGSCEVIEQLLEMGADIDLKVRENYHEKIYNIYLTNRYHFAVFSSVTQYDVIVW
jgi:ankyrin repeat protein